MSEDEGHRPEAGSIESHEAAAPPVVIRPAPDLDGLEAGMDLPAISHAAQSSSFRQESFTSESEFKPESAFRAGAQGQTDNSPAAPGANRFALLAAAVALAAALGAMIGSAATAGIAYLAMASDTPATPTRVIDPTQEINALKTIVAKSRSDIGKLKASIDSTARLASTQFARITSRIEHAEKAQSEPAAKLAAIEDALGRIERRVVLNTPHASAHENTASASSSRAKDDITGSVSAKETPAEQAAQKQTDRPRVVAGWVLRDIYRGRALVENRYAGLFEVGPGSLLPGIGRIETIRRQDGKWVVVTPKGIITSMR